MRTKAEIIELIKKVFRIKRRKNIKFYNVKPYFYNISNNNFVIGNDVKVLDDNINCALYKKQYCYFSSSKLLKIKNKTLIVAPFKIKCFNGGTIEIGEDVHIMANAKIYSNCLLEIGDYSYIAENVHIRTCSGHLIDGKDDTEEIIIGKAVWIGANVTILPGVHIGNGSIIGACAVVTKDIPPHCLAVGNPARVIRENIVWGKDNYSTRCGE